MVSVSRRTMSLALSLALALIVVIGAIPAGSPAHAQDTSTITIGVTDLPNTLDPGDAYDFVAWDVIRQVYSGLTRQVPGTTDYELALASGVQVSDDKLTYTFTLRDDAAFSDGTPITAQTFVDSINRVLALRRDATQAIKPYVDSVTANDAGELVFTLTRPVPYFLGLVSLPPYFAVPPAMTESTEADPFPESVNASGPYTVASFEVGKQIILQANPAYNLGPQPVTPTIVLRRYDQSLDLRNALQRHEIDMAWRALFLDDLLTIKNNPGSLNVVDVPSTRTFYLYMNHDLEPFDDPLVRQAVTLLITRQPIVNTVFHGSATPLTSMVPDLFPNAYAPVWPDAPDVAQAEETLRAAGYSTRGTARLQITIFTSQPTYGNTYVLAAEELNRSSFRPTDFIEGGVFANIDTSTFVRALERGEDRMALFAWTPIVPHPDAYLRPLVHSDSPIPSNGEYAKIQTDKLLDDAALSDDPTAQGADYREVSDWLLEDYDIIPVWQDHIQAIAWDDIGGIQVEPNFVLHYELLARQ